MTFFSKIEKKIKKIKKNFPKDLKMTLEGQRVIGSLRVIRYMILFYIFLKVYYVFWEMK